MSKNNKNSSQNKGEQEIQPYLDDVEDIIEENVQSSSKKLLYESMVLHTVDPLKFIKDPRDVIEFCSLQNSDIQYIHPNIEKLVNMEVLMVNDNKLSSIEGLGKNFRIKHLYAQNNKIERLDLKSLRFLQTLILHDNHLRDLEKILSDIKHLHFLEILDLYANPVAEEKDYRMKVISTFPRLDVLDKKVIHPEERREATIWLEKIQKKGKKSKSKLKNSIIVFGRRMPKEEQNYKMDKAPLFSPSVQELIQEVDRIKREQPKIQI